MTYWHIQIFKSGDESGTEKKILEEKGFIGLGYTNKNQEKQFKEDMRVGDIVLVRRGVRSIALVEVISECIDRGGNDFNALDWCEPHSPKS